MSLTPYQEDVLAAKICPYCKSKTRIATEEEIYGKSFSGRAMICCQNYPRCDAYVGCHDDGRPMGRLADWTHRRARMKAHEAFDRLWQTGMYDRKEAYAMLAEHLDIPDEYCHLGMLNVLSLRNVRNWAQAKWNEHYGEGDNTGPAGTEAQGDGGP